MNPAPDHTYLSVGQHKGSARLYLQGDPLRKARFTRGASYIHDADPENGVYRLRLAANGTHTVSGKVKAGAEYPVIDLLNKTLSKVTHGADEVRIDFEDGCITVSVNGLLRRQMDRESRLAEEVKAGRLTKGTLCAGGGMATLALHEGLEKHGIRAETRWIADREGKYLDVARRNNPAVTDQTTVIQGRLEEIDRELVKSASLVQFSLPCTGQSRSGKTRTGIKLAEEHSDATAVYGLMKLFESMNAAIYVSENVPEAEGSATYILIRQTLQVLNYRIIDGVLDSAQSGSFENRPRYWFVAVSAGLPLPDWNAIPRYAKQYPSIVDLLDDVPDNSPMWSDHQYLKDKAERDRQAGKGFKRQLLDRDDRNIGHCGCINRTYHKRQSTPPYIVRPGVDRKERLFTLREQAKAKSCDPSLVAGTSFTTGTEILGQGIDMGHGRGIAEMIAQGVLLPVAGAAHRRTEVPRPSPIALQNSASKPPKPAGSLRQQDLF